jgi:hypothetical protein
LTVVPFEPPVGARCVNTMITLGNLTICNGPAVTAVPPSVSTQNFLASAMFGTLR